jgi:ATP-dependent DNA helicase RecG
MRKEMSEAKLSEPEFRTDGLFTVVFKRDINLRKIKKQEPDTKSDAQTKIILLIRENSKITTAELVTALNVSNSTIERILSKLKKNDVLHRVGSKKDGEWVVANEMRE